MSPRLVTIGGILVDVVLYVPRLPAPGGDVLATDAVVTTGGAFNALVAAQRQGLAAAYLGPHGTGRFGDQVRADLATAGIALGCPASTEGDSGFCIGMVDETGERTYATRYGVEGRLTEADLDGVRLAPDDLVFLSGYELAYAHARLVGDWWAGLDVRHLTFFDPGPVIADVAHETPDLLEAVLRRTDWVSLNRAEALALTGSDEPAEALLTWAERWPRPRAGVVLRDGRAGCWVLGRDDDVVHVPVPGPAVDAVDTSGAGDCHLGAFAAATSRGDDPASSARWANAAAAISVQRVGPATGPTYDEVDAALAS